MKKRGKKVIMVKKKVDRFNPRSRQPNGRAHQLSIFGSGFPRDTFDGSLLGFARKLSRRLWDRRSSTWIFCERDALAKGQPSDFLLRYTGPPKNRHRPRSTTFTRELLQFTQCNKYVPLFLFYFIFSRIYFAYCYHFFISLVLQFLML